MEKEKLFSKAETLLERLATYRKTGTVKFKNMDEKMTLKEVYQEIFPQFYLDLSCSGCVLAYLNNLLAWYERERPKFDASSSRETLVEPKSTTQYQGIKQEPIPENQPESEDTPKVEEAPKEAPVKKGRKVKTNKSK